MTKGDREVVSPEEATNKKPSRKKFDEPDICPACKGEGTLSGDFLDEPCETCQGEGVCWRY